MRHWENSRTEKRKALRGDFIHRPLGNSLSTKLFLLHFLKEGTKIGERKALKGTEFLHNTSTLAVPILRSETGAFFSLPSEEKIDVKLHYYMKFAEGLSILETLEKSGFGEVP